MCKITNKSKKKAFFIDFFDAPHTYLHTTGITDTYLPEYAFASGMIMHGTLRRFGCAA